MVSRRQFLSGVPPWLASLIAPSISLAAEATAPGATTSVTTFALQEANGATSRGLKRFGVVCKRGDVPAGAVLSLQRAGREVPVQFDAFSAWEDGSVRFCVGKMRDSDFPARAERPFELHASPGRYDRTGTLALRDVTQICDFSLRFTGVTNSAGARVGSGTYVARFAEQAAVPTRITRYEDGGVCTSWQIWGMAKDEAGPEHPHLKTIWYVTAWNDGEGHIAAIEACAVVAQDWWSVPDKDRLDYDCEFRNGTSVIASYPKIQHYYKAQWATVRKDNDAQHAMRFWFDSAGRPISPPSLNYKPNRDYWIEAGLAPPFDLSLPVIPADTDDYVPLGALSHRAGVDDTGAYMGRGIIARSDTIAFIAQTPAAVRAARVNSFAGLHIPYHYRSNRIRRRPADAKNDIANTVIAMRLEPKPAAAFDFTADGMPQAVYAESTLFSGGSMTDGYVAPSGGSGPWVPSIDASHAVNFSYFMYLLEGERYFMEASLDLATNLAHQTHWNIWGAMPYYVAKRHPDVPARVRNGLPTTLWSACTLGNSQQTRGKGWASVILSSATAIVPDDDVQARFMRAYAAHNYEHFATTFLPYLIPTHRRSGAFEQYTEVGPGVGTPFVEYIIEMGLWWAWQVLNDKNARALAEYASQLIVKTWTSKRKIAGDSYRATMKYGPQPADDVTNPYHDEWMVDLSLWSIAPDGTFSQAQSSQGQSSVLTRLADGDAIIFTVSDTSGLTRAIPPEVVAGKVYYIVNASEKRFKVSATQNGSPLTFALAYPEISLFGTLKAMEFERLAGSWHGNVPADSYIQMARAAMVLAYRNGAPGATPELAIAPFAFLTRAVVGQAEWPNWSLVPRQVRGLKG